jgi:peptide deformylase
LHAARNDHCDGIVFLDKMSTIKREIVKAQDQEATKSGKWDSIDSGINE